LQWSIANLLRKLKVDNQINSIKFYLFINQLIN
jgi:hypothetical protein